MLGISPETQCAAVSTMLGAMSDPPQWCDPAGICRDTMKSIGFTTIEPPKTCCVLQFVTQVMFGPPSTHFGEFFTTYTRGALQLPAVTLSV